MPVNKIRGQKKGLNAGQGEEEERAELCQGRAVPGQELLGRAGAAGRARQDGIGGSSGVTVESQPHHGSLRKHFGSSASPAVPTPTGNYPFVPAGSDTQLCSGICFWGAARVV